MSFTANIKEEISKLKLSKSEIIATLSAFIRTNARIDDNKIEISTENSNIAKLFYNFIKDIYNVKSIISTKKNNTFNRNNIYIVEVFDKKNIILEDLSVVDENGVYLEMPKDYIVDNEEDLKAYIRGVFLAKGSINDPKTSRYHLEILLDRKYESVFFQRALNSYDLNSKILMRDNKYMVYIKESEKISDFLKIINAVKAVLYYENVRAFREQINITNRLNNCEQANIDKVVMTSTNQIKDIMIIEKELGLDFLDDKIKEACIYRKKYPEASLIELSEIITMETGNNITKSGLNHRFRKIKEIAKKIQEKDIN